MADTAWVADIAQVEWVAQWGLRPELGAQDQLVASSLPAAVVLQVATIAV